MVIIITSVIAPTMNLKGIQINDISLKEELIDIALLIMATMMKDSRFHVDGTMMLIIVYQMIVITLLLSFGIL
jgi:hypothetical protein